MIQLLPNREQLFAQLLPKIIFLNQNLKKLIIDEKPKQWQNQLLIFKHWFKQIILGNNCANNCSRFGNSWIIASIV